MKCLVPLVLLFVDGCIGFGLTLPPSMITHAVTDALLMKMFQCEKSSPSGPPIMNQMLAYWQTEFQLEKMDRNLGCLATCALLKLKWINASEEFIEENLHKFLVSQRADRDTILQHIDGIKKCYIPQTDSNMNCTTGFEFLKCYRKSMAFQLGWHPLELVSNIFSQFLLPLFGLARPWKYHRSSQNKDTISRQIDAIKKCYVPQPDNKISCTPGFEFLKCYRNSIFQIGWNPLKLVTKIF